MTFTFYATFAVEDLRPCLPAGIPVLLPASSWARRHLAPPRLPAHVTECAADCGGFVATRVWGDYRYTAVEYVSWLASWPVCPAWAATMDYCCEDEITAGVPGLVRERQERTTAQAFHFWQHYRSVPWVWVPTVQGWFPNDYQRHAHDLAPLLSEMAAYYGPCSSFRVGVGTLCARASVCMIDAVLCAVRAELPDMPLHLWGVKLEALKSIDLTNVVSSDSAAWHGLFSGPARRAIGEAARGCGLSVREYVITRQLPRYYAKVHAAVLRLAPAPLPDCSALRAFLKHYGFTLRLRPSSAPRYVYAARRVGSRVVDTYLGPLSSVLSLSASALLAKLPLSMLPLWGMDATSETLLSSLTGSTLCPTSSPLLAAAPRLGKVGGPVGCSLWESEVC